MQRKQKQKKKEEKEEEGVEQRKEILIVHIFLAVF